MRNYDPLDFKTWPDDLQDFAGRVWRGLHDGDLQPLAEYLRAGHYIEPALAAEIADAIEKKDAGFYHIVCIGRRPGQVGLSEAGDRFTQKLEVGVFIERSLRAAEKGQYDSIVQDAMDKFKVGSTAAKSSLAFTRKFAGRMQVKDGDDPWEILFRSYSGG